MWAIASTIGIANRNNMPYKLPFWKYSLSFMGKYEAFHGDVKTVLYSYFGAPYKEIHLGDGENYDLEGYFQSWRYFEDCKEDIYKFFAPRMYPDLTVVNSVAIHIRRGDYLNHPEIHPIMPMEYYREAMSHFPGEKFTIYSDDIMWCLNNFDLMKDNVEFVPPSEYDIVDFLRMNSHKAFIIANSSFSWWAAYLAKDRPVIAPDLWALNEDRNVIEDRLPKEWTRIHVENH